MRRVAAVALAATVLAGAPFARTAASASAAAPPAAAPPAAKASTASESYTLLTSSGALIGFGAALGDPGAGDASPSVAVAATGDGEGALIAEADGGVVARGDAVSYGSMAGVRLAQPIVGIALDPATGGYWLAAADGGIFSFHAPFFGSAGNLDLNQPIVGIAAMPDGHGYRLVAADGGVFDYGDAKFYGSTGSMTLARPIVGITASADGSGYWLVASDGGIFTFGDAHYRGSTGGTRLNEPIAAMAATSDGYGYWLVASDGGVFAFGDAKFFGAGAPAGDTVVGIAPEIGGYLNPLRGISGLAPGRIDQGVDYAGSGPIYAVGDGVVLETTNSGWPGGAFIAYQLSDGPAKGYIVYAAENIKPAVQVGQQVGPSTVLGTLVDAFPNLETGWGAPPPDVGESYARYANDAATYPTIYGVNFSQLLVSLGAPGGVAGGPPSGTLPAGWPTWTQGS